MTRPGSSAIHPRMLARVAAVLTGTHVDACTVTRPTTAAPSWNPASGREEYAPPTTVYTGPCRVQPVKRNERTLMVGGQEATVRRYAVLLPAAALVFLNDTVTVTASTDPELVGQALHVVDVHASSLGPERVLSCIDVDDLGTWRSA